MRRVSILFLLLVAVIARAGEAERIFRTFNASNGLADNSAQTIACTKTGRMVITTIGHINFYDGANFVHIDPAQEDIYRLANYRGNYHLYFDKMHHLWLKNTHSVTCVDLLAERFVPEIEDVFLAMGIKQPVVDLFSDSNSFLWLMTGDSIYCVEHQFSLPVLKNHNLQDLIDYDGKELLLFYDNSEVVGYSLEEQKQLYRVGAYSGADLRRYGNSSVLARHANTFYQIRNGAKESILLRFDVEHREWTTLLTCPYHMNNLVVRDSTVYIASEYGYWTYDIARQQATHYPEVEMLDGRRLATDINAIAFDRQGGMWIGTERRGLLYSKPFTSPFRQHAWGTPQATAYSSQMYSQPVQPTRFKGRDVNCVYRDSRGWTWVGTMTGLHLYTDAKSAFPQVFNTHDGLLNEVVHAVIEDNQHDIWASTSYGISYLHVDSGAVTEIKSYNHYDNVPNESFVNGRVMKLSDGTIVMQSLDHMVAFNPSVWHPEYYQQMRLYPKFIKLMVNGTNVEAGTEVDGKRILERAITRTWEINVNYNQNSVTLTFSGLNFFRPVQTYYRYRVKGYYDKWQVVSYFNSNGLVDGHGLFHLPLVGLRPGDYEIEVQASMLPDQWNVDPIVWTLHVEEPWWRTTGIFLLLALLIVSLMVLNFVWYNRNLRLRMLRNNDEAEIIKRIKTFVERCNSYGGEVLKPGIDELQSGGQSQSGRIDLSSDFVSAMTRIVPYVSAHKDERLTMRELAEQGGVDMHSFYAAVSANLHKNPRLLARTIRLERASEMLRTTDLSVEQVAGECGFVSPNYFIASFYHQYKMTPQDYRSMTPR